MKNTHHKFVRKIQASIIFCLALALILYIFLGKPNYSLVNSASDFLTPVARTIGDGITWPVRAFGKLAKNIRVRSGIRAENKELRARVIELERLQTACAPLAAENQRLLGLLDARNSIGKNAVFTNVIYKNNLFSSNMFVLDHGKNSGIHNGAPVLSIDGFLIGIVLDTNDNYANVRGITDNNSNIPVRVSGTDVMGFLRGRGGDTPVIELFSDQEFTPTIGISILSSSAGGNLPDGLPIGKIKKWDSTKSVPIAIGAKTGPTAIVLIK
ncbi:MAG: rod shape-determining protein MreC [Rickettsiales bacterium]|jgi:rod shape-determining protein MreC|nr:rod shape-determining protein MreC [Rickettsiales bacterium]